MGTPDDIKVPANSCTHPDTRCVTDAIKILRKEYGDEVAIIGKTMGPWSQGYHCFGVEPFLLMSLDDPGKTKLCLDRMKEITVEYGLAQLKAQMPNAARSCHGFGQRRILRALSADLHIEMAERLPSHHPTHLWSHGRSHGIHRPNRDGRPSF